MKKILNNFWIQLFLGLIVGVFGTGISSILMIIFWIKYAGIDFFGIGSSGDNSPITYVVATTFTILAFTFPTLVWFLLNRFGSLKTISKKIRIITFILFVTLPLWISLGLGAFSKLQTTYKDYRSVRDPCIIKNGVNKITVNENLTEFECKNGVFNGFTKTYNSKRVLVYEKLYLDGKQDGVENIYYDSGKLKIVTNYKNGEKEGTEIFYNENGSTSLYVINDQGKSRQIYHQSSERNLNNEIDLESQNFFCENQEKYLSENYNYSCSNNVVNGEFIKYDSKGGVQLKVKITNGVLDGIYELFTNGKLYEHLEFKNGNLDGRIYKLSSEGKLEYEGQYVNGLQDGIFRRYSYKGNVETEVVFENGRIIRINIR